MSVPNRRRPRARTGLPPTTWRVVLSPDGADLGRLRRLRLLLARFVLLAASVLVVGASVVVLAVMSAAVVLTARGGLDLDVLSGWAAAAGVAAAAAARSRAGR